MTEEEPGLRAELREGRWRLAGAAEGELINGYLGYLADRGFSARTVRAYAFGLAVADVDIPRGWVRVMGEGGKERRVPLDPDVAGLIQAYLLAGRPETSNRALFVVAKGPHRGSR